MRSVNEELIRLTRREALRWRALGAAALGAAPLLGAYPIPMRGSLTRRHVLEYS